VRCGKGTPQCLPAAAAFRMAAMSIWHDISLT
jgi:hypothetical protein